MRIMWLRRVDADNVAVAQTHHDLGRPLLGVLPPSENAVPQASAGT